MDPTLDNQLLREIIARTEADEDRRDREDREREKGPANDPDDIDLYGALND